MAKLSPLYRYKAKVRTCYDGDTIRVDLDLGFGIIWENQSIRLYGIDAPEIRGDSRPAGLDSRDTLRALLIDQEVIIRTFLDRRGKYGRVLGLVYLDGEDGWFCVNKHMVDQGMAELNTYGDKWNGWPGL